MKKILIVLLLIGILFIGDFISGVLSIGAERIPTDLKCSENDRISVCSGISTRELSKMSCVDFCEGINMNYATYKCENDILVCYCR